jgi:YD repeat-containing protein
MSTVAYNPVGRVTRRAWRAFDGTLSEQVFGYDSLGRLSTESLPRRSATTSEATQYGYDLLDRLTSVANPNGSRIAYTYPSFFRSERRDEVDRQSYTVTDVVGTIMATGDLYRDPGSTTTRTIETRFAHTLNEQLSTVAVTTPGATPGATIVAQFGFDALGRLKQVSDPDAKTTRSVFYDAFGGVRRDEIDGAATSIDSFYDHVGRLIRREYNEGGVRREATFEWDARIDGTGRAGELARATSPDGVTTSFRYDELGRLSHTAQQITETPGQRSA